MLCTETALPLDGFTMGSPQTFLLTPYRHLTLSLTFLFACFSLSQVSTIMQCFHHQEKSNERKKMPFIIWNIYFCERNDSQDICWVLESEMKRNKSLVSNSENLILNHACSSVHFLRNNFPLKYSTHLGDQIRMSDDCADKEPVVCHFCANFYLGCPKIQVHLVISTWNGSKVKISHPVQL